MTTGGLRLAMPKSAARVATARLLDQIIDRKTTINALLHPLGFICYPLERDGHRGVCLHAWDDELWQGQPHTELTTSPIHSHSWDMVSYVVHGTVCNSVIEISDADTQPEFRVAEIHSDGDIDMIRPTDRLVRATVVASEWHSDGDVYRLDARVFHTTSVTGPAVTLAFGSGNRGAVDLSLAPLEVVPHAVHRTRCDEETTVRFARAIRERIADPAPVQRFR
ncbi:hypothetical protein [Nocardia sp. IFM 10818]